MTVGVSQGQGRLPTTTTPRLLHSHYHNPAHLSPAHPNHAQPYPVQPSCTQPSLTQPCQALPSLALSRSALPSPAHEGSKRRDTTPCSNKSEATATILGVARSWWGTRYKLPLTCTCHLTATCNHCTFPLVNISQFLCGCVQCSRQMIMKGKISFSQQKCNFISDDWCFFMVSSSIDLIDRLTFLVSSTT